MTYCLGIKLKEGLVGIADTRISAGTSTTIKRKVFVQQNEGSSLFIMTSGLRSVRDKAVHYFQELVSGGIVYNKLYKAVNGFGEQIKRVAIEDKEALMKSGYRFDLNAIVGRLLERRTVLLPNCKHLTIQEQNNVPKVIPGLTGKYKASIEAFSVLGHIILMILVNNPSRTLQLLQNAFHPIFRNFIQ